MGIGYMALGGIRAKCRTGWSGVDGVDTPWTVMTTRAPAVLKMIDFYTISRLSSVEEKLWSDQRSESVLMQHCSKLPSTLSECSVIRPDDSLFAFFSHSILQGTVPSQFSVALALKSSITRKLWQASKLNCKLSVERFFCSFVHVHSLILV